MTEELVAVALGVSKAHLRIKRVEENIGCAEITLRSDSQMEPVIVAGYLRKYLLHADEISVLLLRPANGEVVGKLMAALGYNATSQPPTKLVEKFTAILRGEEVSDAD